MLFSYFSLRNIFIKNEKHKFLLYDIFRKPIDFAKFIRNEGILLFLGFHKKKISHFIPKPHHKTCLSRKVSSYKCPRHTDGIAGLIRGRLTAKVSISCCFAAKFAYVRLLVPSSE